MTRCRGLARQLALSLFVSFVVLLRQGLCLAQSEAPREVELVLVGALGDGPVFASRVTSWFAPERFHVSVRRAPFLEPKQVLSPSADAFVHIWVTLSNNKSLARLYFASAGGSGAGGTSYFLRELRLENGLDEIGAEHVAEVLNLSTQAFVEGQAQSAREELERTLKAEQAPEPSAPPPSMAPAAAKPTPPPAAQRDAVSRSEPRRSFGARVGYALSYRADEGTWHGPSAALELALWRKLGLRAAAQGALPGQRELEPLELRFYGVAFVLAATFRHALGAGIDLQWFGGPALDVVRYAPVRPLSADFAAGKAATEARPGLAAGVEALWGRWPVVALVAQASMPFTKTHYDVVRAETRDVIGKASPVVPTLGVEVGF